MIRIAVDVGIGLKRIKLLEEKGFKVVCIANHSESDKKWLKRSFVNKATFVISPDMDIPKLIEIECYPMIWINYPSDLKQWKENELEYIQSRICSKRIVLEMIK